MMKCRDCKTYHHEWCDIKHDSPDPDNDRYCRHFKQATNADRIRSMTDEKLALYICHLVKSGNRQAMADYECGLNWLKDGCDTFFFEWLQTESGEA